MRLIVSFTDLMHLNLRRGELIIFILLDVKIMC